MLFFRPNGNIPKEVIKFLKIKGKIRIGKKEAKIILWHQELNQ